MAEIPKYDSTPDSCKGSFDKTVKGLNGEEFIYKDTDKMVRCEDDKRRREKMNALEPKPDIIQLNEDYIKKFPDSQR